MGFGGADGFHIDKNSGGTIIGGGTVDYIPLFTPNGTTLGNSILTQDPGSNPLITEQISSATVQTTNNTTTTLQTIAIPNNSVMLIESRVVCRKTAGAGVGTVGEGNGYVRTVKVTNIAGVLNLGTIQSSYTSEDIGVFNATFDISGTDVRVRVTGSANNTVTWNVITKLNSVL